MKRLCVVLILATGILSAGRAAAQGVDPFLKPAPPGPPESGVSIGLSVGYALPMGNVSGTQKLSDVFSGAVPLQVDAGWRFTPNLYLGAFFQYSFAFVASPIQTNCDTGGVTCSGSDMQFGVNFVYTFLPYATFAPYVGLGVGWEIGTINYSGGNQQSESVSGFQFARILVGGDFRVGSAFRVGPFVNFSLGQYSTQSSPDPTANGSIPNKALHSWLQFGIKGTLDL
jgi:opacity protein-like surface antigen